MPADRPNVLFIQSDEHAFRHFSYLDPEAEGEPVSTPTLDSIATSGTTFHQAYCPAPLCTPSRICTLTGRRARSCGAWSNGSVLLPRETTLPETLSAAGYETCHVGKLHLEGNRQFVGFDRRPYGNFSGAGGHQPDPPTPEEDRGIVDVRSRTKDAGVTAIPESMLQERNVADESVAFLREHRHRNSDRPWFLNASFSRPHFPLTAPRRHFERYLDDVPPPKIDASGDAADHPVTRQLREYFRIDEIDDEEAMRSRAAYFACVDFLDEVLGEFLATLDRDGFLEDTIVVYASDHGELAGEHGLWWKSSPLEASARVPWFVETPAHRSGDRSASRIETPVSLIDLYPTVCGLAGVDPPGAVDGVDLSASVREGTEPDRGPVFCDYLHPRIGEGTEFRMVRDGRYKYVRFRDAPELLFDLEADPHEQRNLATDPGGDDADALARLRGLVDETMDFDAAEDERRADEERYGEYQLHAPRGTGIAYLLPDGRLVDADTPLYHPEVLAEDPAAVFEDFPATHPDRPGKSS